jgi:predicted DNA-binding transcriptional regulator YafY
MEPMKAERLLTILNILLSRRKVPASMLARELEVSIRTVYRDIEALSEAGIPVFATQGCEGGFELVEGFTMDSHLLETGEITRILAALPALGAVLPGPELGGIVEKFNALRSKGAIKGVTVPENHIFIELMPSAREKKTLELIEDSIRKRTVLAIAYLDVNGIETRREIEGEAIVFVWEAWYVWGFCRLRKDFRLFKISRIIDAQPESAPRIGPKADLSTRPWATDWDYQVPEIIELEAEPVARMRLREFFGDECMTESDGIIRVEALFPVDEWVISYVMGLPGKITIRSPERLKATIIERARNLIHGIS